MAYPAKSVASSRTGLVVGSVWLLATLAVLAYGFNWAIFISPADAEQGNIGRILYWHVPHAMLALIFPYINFAASVAYLLLRRSKPAAALAADAWALAAAEVTVVYGSICLVTGMLWGKAAWGIWWAWDARLTSMLLLWLLYVAYLMTRRLSTTGQTSTLSAVLSVFAAIDVPIVYMSIRWWRTQHPAPVFGGAPGSGMDKSMLPAFYWNVLGWAMWGAFILVVRYNLERRRQRVEAVTIAAALAAPHPAQFPSSLPEAGNAF
jgi:heme exporter protein C